MQPSACHPCQTRQEMLDHGAAIHPPIWAEADDPVEQLTALYRVAGVLLEEGWPSNHQRARRPRPYQSWPGCISTVGAARCASHITLWTGVVTYKAGNEERARGYLLRTYGMDQCSLPSGDLHPGTHAWADGTLHPLLQRGPLPTGARSLPAYGWALRRPRGFATTHLPHRPRLCPRQVRLAACGLSCAVKCSL